ncbi:MAG: hypothetical protein RIS70_4300 [Planctomycetota bacterium]
MGIYDREYYRGDSVGFRPRLEKSAVTVLIAVNIAAFLANLLLSSDANPDWLSHAMEMRGSSLQDPAQWWKLLTYGFAHGDPLHLFLNMFQLWMFGREVENALGKREFTAFYLVAMVLGGLWWGIKPFLITRGFNATVLGASGACSAVLLLFILRNPTRTVILIVPMPAWVLGIVIVLFDLIMQRGSNVAVDVHMVGFAFAAAYHWTGLRLTGWMSWRDGFRRVKRSLGAGPALRVHDPSDEADDQDLDRQADQILAKLNAQGDASLSRRERRILEDYSRRTRERLRRRNRDV